MYRALIIGCGRMGAGRDHTSPWLYTHPEAYRALSEHVELVGFVDRVYARAVSAAQRWQVAFAGDDIVGAIRRLKPDIVSICTPPSDRLECLLACARGGVRGVWCEKPYAVTWMPPATMCVQVNYIRRFDPRHGTIRNELQLMPQADLFVIAAKDIHTTSHFTNLAAWWGIPKDRLHYIGFHGPSTYLLRMQGDEPGRYAGWRDEVFTGGGVETGFMERALTNLLEAMDGSEALASPIEDAIAAEVWADEIIGA